MVRLKDIAQRAGVSVMTVSKALRSAPDVAAATRARVRALAQEMGYVPDALAQGLRTRSTALIGLVIPASTNPVFARLILAVEERVRASGADLILAHTLNLAEREETTVRRLISRRVSGLVIFPVHRLETSAPVYEELKRHRIPTVILGPRPPFCSDFVNVQADDVSGGAEVTRHLLQLGHRRIAFFRGPPAAVWAQERFEGYRKALREAGMEVDDRLIYQAGSTIEEGSRAATQLLQEEEPVTAIQAANDLIAIGAANLLLDQGIRIPQELSIAGFGNVLTSGFFRVPLTTVRQPKHSMGMAAMDLLAALQQGENPGSLTLPAALLVRASTAPPPIQPRLGSAPAV